MITEYEVKERANIFAEAITKAYNKLNWEIEGEDDIKELDYKVEKVMVLMIGKEKLNTIVLGACSGRHMMYAIDSLARNIREAIIREGMK